MVQKELAFTQKGGRLYQAAPVDVTLGNNDLVYVRVIVPANKIWWLYAFSALNGDNVARTILVSVVTTGHVVIHELSQKTDLQAGDIGGFPTHENITPAGSEGKVPLPFPILGGNKIQIQFSAGGVSAGGTGKYMLTYLEVDM